MKVGALMSDVSNLKDAVEKVEKGILQLRRLLKKHERIASSGWQGVFFLRDILSKIGKIKSSIPQDIREKLEPWLVGETRILEDLRGQFFSEFGRLLEESLRERSLSVSGQYPVLHFGQYRLEMDLEGGSSTLFWGPEKLRKMKLEPRVVVRAVEGFEKKLRARSLKPAEFLEKLYQAYRVVLQLKNLRDGERVHLVDVMVQLVLLLQDREFRMNPTSENFRGYHRAFFGYDLSRVRELKEARDLGFSLILATFDSTRDREKAIYVPEGEYEGSRYSFLAFEARGD